MNGHRAPARVRSQRGSFTVIAGFSILALAAMVLGGAYIGRLTLVRTDAQRSADAAALAAVQLIRDRGMPFTNGERISAESAGGANSASPVRYEWGVTQDNDSVDIAVTARIDVPGPALFGGTRVVSSRAVARVAQTRFDEAERRLPKLILALDYSGSMSQPFGGGGGSRRNAPSKIAVLEDSIRGLLDADLLVDYGAVFYSSRVFRTVNIGPGAAGEIRGHMNRYGAGGRTNTADALAVSRDLLLPTENTGYHVLLVSDGAPCCSRDSASRARNVANTLWDRDMTIFTLEIRDNPPNPSLAQFMTDVAGTPASRRDRSFHFVAESADDLRREFENIVASIVCSVGPVNPRPDDNNSLRVYLASGGSERPVPGIGLGDNLANYPGQERFQYDPGDNRVRLSVEACNAVIDRRDEIVIRFDQPVLTE